MRSQKMVFIDTEFTNLKKNPQMISLGVVAQSGEEFYVKTEFDRNLCSTFVIEVVLPQLGKSPLDFCPLNELQDRINGWLSSIKKDDEDIIIAYDEDVDWRLFQAAVNQRAPLWLRNTRVWADFDDKKIEEYFVETGQARHHALHDARANLNGYEPNRTISMVPR